MADAAVRAAREVWGFDQFRDAVSQTFVPLLADAGDERTFEGTVTHAELGPLLLAQVAAGPHVIGRTSRLVRRADPECYKLSLQVAGRALLRQDGREAVLTPGDLALYDTTRPYELRFDGPFRMIVLMFPRSLLQVPEPSVRRLTGHRIAGDAGLATLVGPFVTGLTRQVERRAATANRCLCDAVLDMLAAALADELGSRPTAANGPRQAALLAQVKEYIEDQLADPDLGPAAIAAAHHISPRYLQKLFEAEHLTVTDCTRELLDPRQRTAPISTIAVRWGLVDASHFSRLFRSTYGMSPSEYRIQRTGR